MNIVIEWNIQDLNQLLIHKKDIQLSLVMKELKLNKIMIVNTVLNL
jgi:hypothetical protein